MNPVLAPERTFKADMQDYLELLRTTNANQCRGDYVRLRGPNNYSYCAVGLTALLLSGKVNPVAFGLDVEVTEDELRYVECRFGKELEFIFIGCSAARERRRVLEHLNDRENLTFPQIADFIEEMGWDIA